MSHDVAEVYLGLGANLGDPVRQLSEAVARLRALVEVRAVSSVYRTEPVGYADQPDFFNLVVAARAAGPPERLLEATRGIEEELGRVRSFRDAPRTLDIDLLDFGGRVSTAEALLLPHPRLHERAFVLAPLAEVAPEWHHPLLGSTAAELLAALPWGQRVELWGELPP